MAILIIGGVLVLVTALRADQLGWLETLVSDLVEDIPFWLDGALSVVYFVGDSLR